MCQKSHFGNNFEFYLFLSFHASNNWFSFFSASNISWVRQNAFLFWENLLSDEAVSMCVVYLNWCFNVIFIVFADIVGVQTSFVTISLVCCCNKLLVYSVQMLLFLFLLDFNTLCCDIKSFCGFFCFVNQRINLVFILQCRQYFRSDFGWVCVLGLSSQWCSGEYTFGLFL